MGANQKKKSKKNHLEESEVKVSRIKKGEFEEENELKVSGIKKEQFEEEYLEMKSKSSEEDFELNSKVSEDEPASLKISYKPTSNSQLISRSPSKVNTDVLTKESFDKQKKSPSKIVPEDNLGYENFEDYFSPKEQEKPATNVSTGNKLKTTPVKLLTRLKDKEYFDRILDQIRENQRKSLDFQPWQNDEDDVTQDRLSQILQALEDNSSVVRFEYSEGKEYPDSQKQLIMDIVAKVKINSLKEQIAGMGSKKSSYLNKIFPNIDDHQGSSSGRG